MNPGILTPPTQFATMPRGLLGRPTPPAMPDGFWHSEALDWERRVRANGGAVSRATLAAVSRFCERIDRAELRSRFFRLNLFVGTGLSASLVPLYRGPTPLDRVFGNVTDTNVNFVAADYNEAGLSSGLRGNGTNKYLNTGLPGNAILPSRDTHMGVGLRETESRTASAQYDALGTFDGARALVIRLRSNGGLNSILTTSFGGSPDTFGDSVLNTSLAVGNIIGSFPVMFRNGTRSGAASTVATPADFNNAPPFFVFALSNNSSPQLHTNARLNWYSIGRGMLQWQAQALQGALEAFDLEMNRA